MADLLTYSKPTVRKAYLFEVCDMLFGGSTYRVAPEGTNHFIFFSTNQWLYQLKGGGPDIGFTKG